MCFDIIHNILLDNVDVESGTTSGPQKSTVLKRTVAVESTTFWYVSCQSPALK